MRLIVKVLWFLLTAVIAGAVWLFIFGFVFTTVHYWPWPPPWDWRYGELVGNAGYVLLQFGAPSALSATIGVALWRWRYQRAGIAVGMVAPAIATTPFAAEMGDPWSLALLLASVSLGVAVGAAALEDWRCSRRRARRLQVSDARGG